MSKDITRDMLKTIRKGIDSVKNNKVKDYVNEEVNLEKDNFLTRSKILMEEAEKKTLNEDNSNLGGFPIKKDTPQFGDVRASQEEAIMKTIGEQIKFDDDSLMYYPSSSNGGENLVFNATIPPMNTSFMFKLNDQSGRGCYIYCDGLQLTDENVRAIGKILDAYVNWKNALIDNADLLDKLAKVVEKH